MKARVVTDGAWPESYKIPDAIVMYCDGYKGHIAKRHQDEIQEWVDAGVGVSCLHFGVEVEPSELGQQFLDWIGGYFEIGWSVNPHWDAEFTEFPDHAITRGVQPFTIRDEWYYHMRFQPDMANVTPILSALPPVRTLTDRAKDKNRGSNAAVMASHAHEFSHGIERLELFWRSMHCRRVYRTDAWTVLKSGLRFASTLLSGGLIAGNLISRSAFSLAGPRFRDVK